MLSQAAIKEILGRAFNDKQAFAVSEAINSAIVEGRKDMADLKDIVILERKLEVVNAQLREQISKDIRSMTVWLAGILLTCTVAAVAVISFIDKFSK